MANMTPAQLAAMKAYLATPQGQMMGYYKDPKNGLNYAPQYDQGDGGDGGAHGALTNIHEYDPAQNDNQNYKSAYYAPDGQFQQTWDYAQGHPKDNAWKLAFGAAMAGGLGFDSGLLGGGGGAAGGPGSPGWGMDLGGAGAADTTYGANIGADMGGAGASGAEGAGGSGYGFDGVARGPNFSQGFTDGGTAGGALDSAYTSATAGIPFASGAGGLAGTLGKYAGLLGPALTAGGALLGSKGSQNTITQEHKMDPRLDGPVFGAGGIVPQAQGLLSQQMSPQSQQAWQQMQDVGRGLLSNPIAGNGFSRFTGR